MVPQSKFTPVFLGSVPGYAHGQPELTIYHDGDRADLRYERLSAGQTPDPMPNLRYPPLSKRSTNQLAGSGSSSNHPPANSSKFAAKNRAALLAESTTSIIVATFSTLRKINLPGLTSSQREPRSPEAAREGGVGAPGLDAAGLEEGVEEVGELGLEPAAGVGADAAEEGGALERLGREEVAVDFGEEGGVRQLGLDDYP